MKKLTCFKWIFPLVALFTFLVISCSDDIDPYNPDPSDESGYLYPTGARPAEPEEWDGIPVLTNISQLGWEDTDSSGRLMNNSTVTVKFLDELPTFNQDPYLSCTASSIAYTVALLTRKISGMPISNDNGLYHFTARTFSVAFLDGKIKRFDDPTYSQDDIGTSIPSGVKVLQRYGIPTEEDFPYYKIGVETTGTPIEKKAYFNGSKNNFNPFKIEFNQNTEDLIKAAIRAGSPVNFVLIYPKVTNKRILDGKIVDKVKLLSSVNGGFYSYHALTIVGYDNSKNAFLILNSWGENWGEKINGKGGYFWLNYDVLSGTYPDGKNMMTDFATMGISNDTKEAQSSKLYEFTGYQGYRDVSYSPNGIMLGNGHIGDKETPYVEISPKGYIEYPMNTVIPSQGTIEIDVLIDKNSFYQEVYSSINMGVITPSASIFSTPLFTTFISSQAESRVGQTGSTIGGMELRVSTDGSVRVRIAEKSFDQAVYELQTDISSSGTNTLVFPASHRLNLDGWNRIGLSMGSEGLKIMINGNVSSFPCTIPLSSNQLDTFRGRVKPFTIGYSTVKNDRWWFTIGSTTVGGTNKLYREGYIGYIRAFRTSARQADWIISK